MWKQVVTSFNPQLCPMEKAQRRWGWLVFISPLPHFLESRHFGRSAQLALLWQVVQGVGPFSKVLAMGGLAIRQFWQIKIKKGHHWQPMGLYIFSLVIIIYLSICLISGQGPAPPLPRWAGPVFWWPELWSHKNSHSNCISKETRSDQVLWLCLCWERMLGLAPTDQLPLQKTVQSR